MIEQFNNHIDFINTWIQKQPKQGYGIRAQMAKLLRVQTGYLSQVLSGSIPLKEEHALSLVEYMGLNQTETDYFINLLAIERAGNQKLKSYYQDKAKQLKKQILESITIDEKNSHQTAESLEQYYSSWLYVALHILTSVHPVKAKELSLTLGIDEDKLTDVLNHLNEIGFVEKDNDLYLHSTKQVHIAKENRWVNQHHANWRIKSIDDLHKNDGDSLHYTSIISCSKEDFESFKEKMREMIKELRGEIKDSKEEIVCCYTLDFFSVFDPS